jgi:hypothetical protein
MRVAGLCFGFVGALLCCSCATQTEITLDPQLPDLKRGKEIIAAGPTATLDDGTVIRGFDIEWIYATKNYYVITIYFLAPRTRTIEQTLPLRAGDYFSASDRFVVLSVKGFLDYRVVPGAINSASVDDAFIKDRQTGVRYQLHSDSERGKSIRKL